MIQFICEECGGIFVNPVTKEYKENLGEFIRTYKENTCPYCGSEDFSAADLCQCGSAKREGTILCLSCQTWLKEKFAVFADALTADEEKQMDEWLDGCSITEREKWC